MVSTCMRGRASVAISVPVALLGGARARDGAPLGFLDDRVKVHWLLDHAQIKRARLLHRRPLKRCIVLRLPIDARAYAARDREKEFIELHNCGARLSADAVLLLAVLALQVRREGARILSALRLLGDQLNLEFLLGLLRREAIRAHQRVIQRSSRGHPEVIRGHQEANPEAIQSAHWGGFVTSFVKGGSSLKANQGGFVTQGQSRGVRHQFRRVDLELELAKPVVLLDRAVTEGFVSCLFGVADPPEGAQARRAVVPKLATLGTPDVHAIVFDLMRRGNQRQSAAISMPSACPQRASESEHRP